MTTLLSDDTPESLQFFAELGGLKNLIGFPNFDGFRDLGIVVRGVDTVINDRDDRHRAHKSNVYSVCGFNPGTSLRMFLFLT